ncbi:GPI ethanolamine phosphate transferase 3 [Portunus trituberculatus]|uniref:GPI ethanolamine phosphate transferase 3 n=1 Tax=Portunus trituberculatus TaxID=210409 RepID=A0A5B7CS28_PORTR|nr:GPI ethanolamine phosphate transferase 3 [Portunus trituberculatus]
MGEFLTALPTYSSNALNMWKTRHQNCEVLVVIFCLSELLTVGLLLFSHGFLLTRQVIPSNSTCDDFRDADADHKGETGSAPHTREGCWMTPPFKKAIIVIIDALRYDFAHYNASLKDEDALPYQNKMPVFGEMVKQYPRQAQLSPFMADPPTTTMQRLKGLTTGSLPTFIDASHNFASEEIEEDNIVDQLVRHGRHVTVLGDDTWGGLFPGRFNRSHLYSSFNVMDLHTVDRGVLSHLGEEMGRDDWEVIVAHFLGVDHCGHRYGPNHPQMAAKLTQMNKAVSQIIAGMDNNTLLLVLGDHGMTQTGDHGGDSREEVEAALFVYSPALHLPFPPVHTLPVAQVDLVPTLALCLGVPVPFSSLGKVMESALVTAGMSAEEAEKQRHRGLHLNVQQVKRYLTAYRELGNTYPQDLWHSLELLEGKAQEKSSVGGERTAFSEYLSLAKVMCEEIWARFDVQQMLSGLCLMLSALVMAALFIHSTTLTNIKTHMIVGKKSCSGKGVKVFGSVFSVACGGGWAAAVVCVRCSGWFWRCREEQHWCIPGQAQVPLSGLPQHLHNWRYFTSVLLLAVAVWLPRRWLLLCGNLNGGRASVLLARIVPVVCGVLVAVWWAIQAVISAHNLDIWGHVIPPRVIYAATVVHMAMLACMPLLIYKVPSTTGRKSRPPVSDNPNTLIPHLCHTLMEQYRRQDSKGPAIPVVYGLATALSAPTVAVLMELVRPGWAAACLWFTLSLHGFYSTGHQPTFPALHWSAAFVGLEGAHSVGNWAPALLVGLNTYSSHLLLGLALPLVVMAPLAISVVFPSLRGSRLEGDEIGRGEFLLVEEPDVLRESLMSTGLCYIFLHAAKVFCTSVAAFVLRRHLMLWKIFAPHFIFEAVGFIVTLLSVLAGLGFTLRVQAVLASWSERLVKAT